MDSRRAVDTLSVADRISFRTNTVDWLLLTPNLGMEFDLRNTNWNRWTIGANIKGNWNTKHTFTQDLVYNVIDTRLELRNYWRIHQATSDSPKGFFQKIFSPNRTTVKHPTTTYYWGIYVDYSKYSILLSSKGYQGRAICAGPILGIIKPLYEFSNGNSLDFELGIAVGACYAKYDVYKHDREDDCYPAIDSKPSHLLTHPVINDLRVGFVYRIGSYPITKKYRTRQDVDLVYADTLIARRDLDEKRKIDNQNRVKDTKIIEKDFYRVYKEQLSIDKREKNQKKKEEKRKIDEAKDTKEAKKNSVTTNDNKDQELKTETKGIEMNDKNNDAEMKTENKEINTQDKEKEKQK